MPPCTRDRLKDRRRRMFHPYYMRQNKALCHNIKEESASTRVSAIRTSLLEKSLHTMQQKSVFMQMEVERLLLLQGASENARVNAEMKVAELSYAHRVLTQERQTVHEIMIRLQIANNELVTCLESESKRHEHLAAINHTARLNAELRAQHETQLRGEAFQQREALLLEIWRLQAVHADARAKVEEVMRQQREWKRAAETALSQAEAKAAEDCCMRNIWAQEKQAKDGMIAQLQAERDASLHRELEVRFQLLEAGRTNEHLVACGRSLEQLCHSQDLQLREYQRLFSQRQSSTSDPDIIENVPMSVDEECFASTPSPLLPSSPPPSPSPAPFVLPPKPETSHAWFSMYEQRWRAFEQNDNHCTLTFAHIPWPVFKFLERLEDLRDADIRSFLVQKHQSDGNQWREEIKRWHTDRFLRVARRLHPAARLEVQEGFNRCIQIVTALREELTSELMIV